MAQRGYTTIVTIFVVVLGLIFTIPKSRNFIQHKLGSLNKGVISEASPNPIPSGNSKQQQSTGNTTRSSAKFGVNTGIGANDPYMPQAYQQAVQAGIGLVRGLCDWRTIEPTQGNWDFSSCDNWINQVTGLKMTPVIQLWLDSRYCREAPVDTPNTPHKESCTDAQFQTYVTQVVNRYKDKTPYYEMGNEPDLRPEWSNYPSSYAKTLHLGYTAAKQADPNVQVLLGGLAACSGQNCNKNFGPAILKDSQYPALQNLDIVNYHTYARKQDLATVYNLIKKAVGNKPIWVTEVGFPSDKRYQDAKRSGYGYPSGEEGQAAYLKDVLPYLLRLGVDKVFWYNLIDVPKDRSEFCTYGLMYLPGKQCIGSSTAKATDSISEKQSYSAYKELIQNH